MGSYVWCAIKPLKMMQSSAFSNYIILMQRIMHNSVCTVGMIQPGDNRYLHELLCLQQNFSSLSWQLEPLIALPTL